MPSMCFVALLNCVTNWPMFTPCWPSAGPIGGAGVAFPPGAWILIFATTAFAMHHPLGPAPTSHGVSIRATYPAPSSTLRAVWPGEPAPAFRALHCSPPQPDSLVGERAGETSAASPSLVVEWQF